MKTTMKRFLLFTFCAGLLLAVPTKICAAEETTIEYNMEDPTELYKTFIQVVRPILEEMEERGSTSWNNRVQSKMLSKKTFLQDSPNHTKEEFQQMSNIDRFIYTLTNICPEDSISVIKNDIEYMDEEDFINERAYVFIGESTFDMVSEQLGEEKGKLFKDAYETIMKFQFNYYNKYKTTYDFFAEQQNIYEGDQADDEETFVQTNEISNELPTEEYSEMVSTVTEEYSTEEASSEEQPEEHKNVLWEIISNNALTSILCVATFIGAIIWIIKNEREKNGQK